MEAVRTRVSLSAIIWQQAIRDLLRMRAISPAASTVVHRSVRRIDAASLERLAPRSRRSLPSPERATIRARHHRGPCLTARHGAGTTLPNRLLMFRSAEASLSPRRKANARTIGLARRASGSPGSASRTRCRPPRSRTSCRVEVELDSVDAAGIERWPRQAEVALGEAAERDPVLLPGRVELGQVDAERVVAGASIDAAVDADAALGARVLVADREADLFGRRVADARPERDAGPEVGVVGQQPARRRRPSPSPSTRSAPPTSMKPWPVTCMAYGCRSGRPGSPRRGRRRSA